MNSYWVSGDGPEFRASIRTNHPGPEPFKLAMVGGRMVAVIPSTGPTRPSTPPPGGAGNRRDIDQFPTWLMLDQGRPGTFIRMVARNIQWRTVRIPAEYYKTSHTPAFYKDKQIPIANELLPWRREGPEGIEYLMSTEDLRQRLPEELRRVYLGPGPSWMKDGPNNYYFGGMRVSLDAWLARPKVAPQWRGGILYDDHGVPCLRKEGGKWKPLLFSAWSTDTKWESPGPKGGEYGWSDPDWTWYDPSDADIRSLDGAQAVEVYYGILAYEYADNDCPAFQRNKDLTPSSPLSSDPFAFVREYNLRRNLWRVRTDLREIKLADGKVIPGLLDPDLIPNLNGMRCKRGWGEQVGMIAVGVVMSMIPGIGTAYALAMYGKQIADMMKSAKAARESAALVQQIQEGAAAAAQMPAAPPPPAPPAPPELEARASGQPAGSTPPAAGGGSAIPIAILIALLTL